MTSTATDELVKPMQPMQPMQMMNQKRLLIKRHPKGLKLLNLKDSILVMKWVKFDIIKQIYKLDNKTMILETGKCFVDR